MRARAAAVVAAVAAIIAFPQYAGAAEAGYDAQHTVGSCQQQGSPVTEGPECQVDASADASTAHIRASVVAAGRTTSAVAGAELRDTFLETSAGPLTLTVDLDVRERLGATYVYAVLLDSDGSPISGTSSDVDPPVDGPHTTRLTLTDDHSAAGRQVTVVVGVAAWYSADTFGTTVQTPTALCWPLYGPFEPICAPVELPPAGSPIWVGATLPESSPAAAIDAIVSPVSMTAA